MEEERGRQRISLIDPIMQNTDFNLKKLKEALKNLIKFNVFSEHNVDIMPVA